MLQVCIEVLLLKTYLLGFPHNASAVVKARRQQLLPTAEERQRLCVPLCGERFRRRRSAGGRLTERPLFLFIPEGFQAVNRSVPMGTEFDEYVLRAEVS